MLVVILLGGRRELVHRSSRFILFFLSFFCFEISLDNGRERQRFSGSLSVEDDRGVSSIFFAVVEASVRLRARGQILRSEEFGRRRDSVQIS